ncbi:MAG: hypothetical protein ACI4GD_12605 [Lachnospiraceae bacterium]
MEQYIGTKIIEAEPMTRGEYNYYRGWVIPENENPKDEGYHVRYSDGYESWSPLKQFDLNDPPKMVHRSTEEIEICIEAVETRLYNVN